MNHLLHTELVSFSLSDYRPKIAVLGFQNKDFKVQVSKQLIFVLVSLDLQATTLHIPQSGTFFTTITSLKESGHITTTRQRFTKNSS